MINAYVTNLGRYNEGCLDGEWLKLPATSEQVQSLLKRIHIDGKHYEEIFITDYDIDINGLYDLLGEYESIAELSYLASLLDDLQDYELDVFTAALALGEHTSSVKDLINLAQNLDCFDFYTDIADEDDLGRYYAEELDCLAIPEHLRNYIDYEAYGRDIDLESGGTFANGGYIICNGGFTDCYNGKEDLPAIEDMPW